MHRRPMPDGRVRYRGDENETTRARLDASSPASWRPSPTLRPTTYAVTAGKEDASTVPEAAPQSQADAGDVQYSPIDAGCDAADPSCTSTAVTCEQVAVVHADDEQSRRSFAPCHLGQRGGRRLDV